jgi:hypothetical protein
MTVCSVVVRDVAGYVSTKAREALVLGGVGLYVEHVVKFFGAELEYELVKERRVLLEKDRQIGFAEEHKLRGRGYLFSVEQEDVGVAVTTRAGDDHVAVKFREPGQWPLLCAPLVLLYARNLPSADHDQGTKKAPAEAGANRRER